MWVVKGSSGAGSAAPPAPPAPSSEPPVRNPNIPRLTFGDFRPGDRMVEVNPTYWPGLRMDFEIRIVTCGLAVGGLVFGPGNEAAMEMERAFPRNRDRLIHPMLLHEGLIDEDWIVVPVDARRIRDPAKDKPLCWHCGYHPTIVSRFVYHDGFRKWLKDMMLLIHNAVEKKTN